MILGIQSEQQQRQARAAAGDRNTVQNDGMERLIFINTVP
jgi:hypothetical protein